MRAATFHTTLPLMVTLLAAAIAGAEQRMFTVEGRIVPPAQGSVTLAGATTPYSNSALIDAGGRFRFRKIEPGTYTLSVFVPNRGERQQTVVVTPSVADKRGRITVNVEMDGPQVRMDDVAQVSVRRLSIPDKARREYDRAVRQLRDRDIEAAESHMRKAVEIAPHYAEAWNYLGTIAYQTQRYPLAEEMFRRSLEEDESLYAPLVNLGGVLINLNRLQEAEQYNRHAVLREPGDALAHSQLGMTLLGLEKLQDAEKHLREAIRLDPAHFSHPQLLLAEVLLRKQDPAGAAAALEHFLQQHPDHPGADALRKRMGEISSRPPE